MPPFKDHISHVSVRRLGEVLAAGDRCFDARRFAEEASLGLDRLELKARVAQVSGVLARHLPGDFESAVAVVLRTVPTSDLTMWEAWPVTDWVADAGMDAPAAALEALAALTAKASGEFAIRPFIDHYPDLTFETLLRWATHPDEEVRRLVSEGSRPRLPWARRVRVLDAQPRWAVPLLDRLRDDPSPYVRRSVANHLNDVSKLDPDGALDIAGRWTAEGGTQVAAVVRQGLRTLVKAGDPRALALVGADAEAHIEVREFTVPTTTVRLGGELVWRCILTADNGRPVVAVVDYVIHFARAGGAPGRKVFKLRTVRLEPGRPVEIVRRHALVPVTTRRYQAGRHRVEVQVNGRVLDGGDFDLVLDQ
jgi:3-methyladenine DNA glycosylase AlkC